MIAVCESLGTIADGWLLLAVKSLPGGVGTQGNIHKFEDGGRQSLARWRAGSHACRKAGINNRFAGMDCQTAIMSGVMWRIVGHPLLLS